MTSTQTLGEQNRARLAAWIEQHEAELRRALRPLLAPDVCDARGLSARDAVIDLLVEVTCVALETAERFDPTRSERLWLLGIGRNVVRQWRDRAITQAARRAAPPQETGRDAKEEGSADLFDRLQQTATPGADGLVIGALWVEQALARLRPADAEIIRLITLQDRDAAQAGQMLGIAPGAARVRLHRALQSLRGVLRDDEVRVYASREVENRNDER